MENHRNGRFGSAAWIKLGINIPANSRYASHNDGYHKLALGADFLSSAGKNYAWLAEGYPLKGCRQDVR